MNAPLNAKLQSVEWGEYEFCKIFNKIKQGRRLKKEDQRPGDIPFVMAGTTNTGVVNYISNPVALFPKNSITIDIFGNTFYRDYVFGAGDDTGVFWSDKVEYSPKAMLFFAVTMQKTLAGRFSYGKKLRSSQSLHFKMMLPIRNGSIDFYFMESFIEEMEAHRVAELEVHRVAELEAYLTVSGLDNYELSSEELDALHCLESAQWDTFNLKKLFGKATRGKRLKSNDRIDGPLPFVTAGEGNEGVSAHIGNSVEVFAKNTRLLICSALPNIATMSMVQMTILRLSILNICHRMPLFLLLRQFTNRLTMDNSTMEKTSMRKMRMH